MKEMKNRNMYSQINPKYIRKHYCFKRACTLLLSLLIFITSESNIWEVLTVSAAESRSAERVITSFSPLPLEISEQMVSVGTPIEELEFPDTLEALCSYKGNNEKDSPDDNDKTKEDDKINDDTDDTDNTDNTDNTDDTDDADDTGDADDTNDNGDSEDSKIPEDDGKDDNTNEDKSDTDNKKGDEGGDKNDDDAVTGKDDGSTGTDENIGDKKDSDASGDGEQNGNGEQKGDETGSDTTDVEDKADVPTGETDNGVNEATENSGTVTDNNENNQTDDTSNRNAEERFDSGKGAVSEENADKEAAVSNAVDVQISSNKVPHKFGITVAAVIAKCKGILSPEIFIDNNFGQLYSLSTGDVHILGDGQRESENGPELNAESETQALTETVIIEGVTWECTSEYDSETPDCYVFTPVLPDGLLLADDVILPDIIVIVEAEEFEPEFMEQVSQFALIADITSGNCGANLTWEYDNGTLTISGNGEMADFETSGSPWAHLADDIENIIIGDGVTSIGMYAFYGCSKVGSLQIPGKVTSIGKYAFYECSSLSSIGIPDSVDFIGEHAFSDCYALVSVNLPSGITEISDSMFSGCSSLQSVNIPSTIRSIKIFAFSGCKSLETITIPDGVETIGNLAFSGCLALEIIEIPDSVQNITAYSFRNCNNAILYYSENLPAADNLAAIKSIKANIKYAITGDGVGLELVGIGSGVSSIELPATVHGGVVVSANWADYPNVKITHSGEHNYNEDGVCAICGDKKESELSPEKTPEAKIDYEDEMLINLKSGAVYLIDGDDPTADGYGKIPIDEDWFDCTISIVKQGDGENTSNSEEQSLPIPARPDAPEDISAVDESAEGAKDGQITGVNDTMVYQMEGKSSWKAVTGNTISNLEPGTYYVCYKAIADKSFRSESVEITINAYEPKPELEPEPTPNAQIAYVNEKLTDLIPGAEYLINEITKKASAKGTIDIEEGWFGSKISIVKAGNGSTTVNSEEQKLEIKARPLVPTGVNGEDESEEGAGDGKLTGVTNEMEYSLAGSEDWVEITGTTVEDLLPGTYYVRIKAVEGESFHSDNIKVVINAYKPNSELTPEDTPNAGIDYIDELLTGLIPGAKYLIDSDEITASGKGTIKIDEYWFDDTISIVKAGDGKTTDDSEEQMLDIPARPSSPTGVKGVDESDEGAGDGKLTGVNSKMEYCLVGSNDWKVISGTTVNNLSPGSYYVRIKAVKDESFHSDNIKIVINAYKPDAELPLEKTPNAGIDYVDELLTGLTPGAKYQIDWNEITASGKGTVKIDEYWFDDTISIVKVGDGKTTDDSEEQWLDIKARPSSPTGVKGVDESDEGAGDGKLTGVNNKMEYCLVGSNDWKVISGTTVNNLSPGSYYVRIKAVKDESFHSDNIKIVINAYKPDAELPLEKTPNAGIDYVDELLTGLTPGAKYQIDWNEITASGQGTVKIDEYWFDDTISIVKVGDGKTTDDSEEQWLDIKARPSSPTGVKGVDESDEGAGDGKLTGVNSKMEYCLVGSNDWKVISGTTVNNLSPGSYYVRIKAVKDESFHSDNIKIVINAYKPDAELPLEKTPNAGIDYIDELLTGLTPGAKYMIDWDEVTASGKGTVKIDEYWFDDTISIVKVGDGKTTDDSEEQWLDIPARPSSPIGVKGVDESKEGAGDGKLTGVNSKMEYSLAESEDWKGISGTTLNNLSPGTYYVRIKAVEGESFHSDSITVIINAGEHEIKLEPEKMPAAQIDYVNEKLTGLISEADYLIDGKEATKNSDGTINISEGWFNNSIKIVKIGNGTTTTNSEEQKLTIPARPAAPTGLGKTDESAEGAKNGKITGVKNTMEYQAEGESSWKAVSGTTISDLAPGTYYVRIKAVANKSFHSYTAMITINEYVKLDPEETPKAQIDYVNEKLTGLISGADYLINKEKITANSKGETDIKEAWFKNSVSIVKKGDGTTKSDSDPQSLTIPARPAAPTGIGKIDESAKGANNGKITNLNTDMVYQKRGVSSWTPVSESTLDGLAPGTYYIRTKAVEGQAFHSENAVIIIEEYVLIPEKTPEASIDYIAETIIGLIGGEAYTIDSDAIEGGIIGIRKEWFGKIIYIKKVGNGTTTKDSAVQRLVIDRRPSAPSGTGKTNETEAKKDGTLTGVNNKMEYRKAGDDSWTPIEGTTVEGLSPGKYEIRDKATGSKFASEIVTQIISSFDMRQEEMEPVSIDYINETLKIFTPGAEYYIDGVSVTAGAGGVIKLQEEWFNSKINIVKAGDMIDTYDSEPQEINIPARPAVPTDVGTEKESEKGANDGKLVNLNSTMEYQREGADEWISVTGTTSKPLEPGIYLVRIKATNESFCSESKSYVIRGYELVPESTPVAKIDFFEETLTGLTPGSAYMISIGSAKPGANDKIYADKDGNIEIIPQWFGRKLNIVKVGDNIITMDSIAREINIPVRPNAPKGVKTVKESYKNAKDGELTNVDSSMQYRQESESGWTDIIGTTVKNKAPGRYIIRIKATSSSFCSDSVTVVISGYELEQEDMPDVEIYYLEECFVGLEPDEFYIINGVEVQADENGGIPINSIWMKGKNVSIIKKGNGHSTTNSSAQTIKVPKRPSAPKGITAVSESAKDENDGKLTGVNEKMEYCLKGSDDWIPIDEDMVEWLEPGTYEIRYISTEDSFASSSVTKTVYPYGTKAPNKGTSNNTQTGGEGSSDNSEDTDVYGASGIGVSSDNKSVQSDSNTNESAEDGTSGDASLPAQDDNGISDADVSEDALDSSEAESEQEDNGGLSETDDDIFYIPSIVDEEKIVPKSEDNVWEEAYNNGFRKVFFVLEHGGVLLNINNIDESKCKANIPDVAAAANAILTTQEIVGSDKGNIVEIRIDIKCIDDSVQKADVELIEQGIDDCNNESLALDMGMYVDISIFKRADGYKWEPVNALNKPIEVSLYIPDSIKAISHEFYVIRAHGGEYKLLNDMDDNADTITVQTHLFSTYALLYKLDDANLYAEGEMNGKQDGYSNIKTFLEQGGLFWLAVILAEIIIIIMIIIYVKNKKKKGNQSLTES